MLTKRDLQIAEFIQEMKVVNSSHVQMVFNVSRVIANRRLNQLVKTKEIKRQRDKFSMNYLYFTDKPTHHKLLVSEFYSRLVKAGGLIIEFNKEYHIGNLQADAFSRYQLNGFEYTIMLEVQLSHSKPDIQKYERLLTSRSFPWKTFPRIIVIYDKEIKYNGQLKVIRLDSELNGFEKIFE